MNKHTRAALAECITYRIIQAVDTDVMTEIEADVLRSISTVMMDRAQPDRLKEVQRVMVRAWKRTGDELLTQMAEVQSQLYGYE